MARGNIILLVLCGASMAFGFFPNDRKNKPITCDEPDIENGDHTPRMGFFEQWRQPLFGIVTFTCNPGFRLNGPEKSRCRLNGEWFPEKPECVAIEAEKSEACVLPAVGDHVDVSPMKAKYETDETVDFACNGFRKAEGFRRTKCGGDGKFHPAPPKCIRPKCAAPAVPENGAIRPNQTSYSVGNVVNFKCMRGYKLVGSTNATCDEDGNFTEHEAKCEALPESKKMCKRPYVSYRQAVVPRRNEYKSGTTIRFYCANGYKLRGQKALRCQSNGQWSSTRPNCRLIYCKKPEDPANGKVESDQTYFRLGDKIKFKCNDGHAMLGDEEAKCAEDGLFYPQEPSCHRSFVGFYKY